MKKIGVLVTHPVQYFSEMFSEMAKNNKVTVFYSHQQTADDQIKSEFGKSFSWPEEIFEGHDYKFLANKAKKKNVSTFFGCNNPDLFREISSGSFDVFIVFGWHSMSYLQAVCACKIYKVPVYIRTDSTLFERRSSLVRVIKKICYPQLLKIPTGFLYVGERSRLFLDYYGVKPDRLYLSPHCVGSKNFYLEKIKKKSAMEPMWKVLVVAALIHRKRITDVILACNEVSEGGRSIQLDIVGCGEKESELMNLAELQGFKVNFHSFKNQTELRYFYTHADVLVLASDDESWGLVVNEAMQCGTPAITSDVVGCGPDLITATTGRVFKVRSVIDLADKIIDLLEDEKVTPDTIISHISKYSVHAAIDVIEKL